MSEPRRIGAARLVIAACFLATGGLAFAQDRGVEAGLPPPKDTIFARKILMGAIDMNMDEIETMLAPEGKLDSVEGREHADAISIMLMAFPHLFPPATNQWKPNVDRDPATDTCASPDLWASFSDFYKRATEASKLAYAASRAERADQFRASIAQLRAACNGCHAAYQKTE